ncbi:MFS transporter [Desulfonauticus submarinus]
MKQNRWIVLIIIFLFFILTLGFNSFLTISSFRKNNLSNYFSLAETIGKRIKSDIETGLIFGKELTTFYGLKKILYKYLSKDLFISNIYVCDKNFHLIKYINEINKNELELIKKDKCYEYTSKKIIFNNYYLLIFPIYKNNYIKGYLILKLSKSLNKISESIFYSQIRIILILSIFSFIILVLFLNNIFKRKILGKIENKVNIGIFLIIISTQIIYAFISTYQYQNKLSTTIEKKLLFIHETLSSDFQFLLNKGVSLSHVSGIYTYLNNILKVNKEVGSIIIDNNKQSIFCVNRDLKNNGILKKISFLNFKFSKPLFKNGKKIGNIVLISNPSFILEQIIDVYLDAITLLILCFVFLGELNHIFIPILWDRLNKFKDVKSFNINIQRFFRVDAFLFFFAYDMPLSFIPIYMENFPAINSLFPKDIWLSLPITLEMLFATLTTLVGGFIIDRYGWKKVFYIGTIFSSSGLFLAALYANLLVYLFSRSLAGAGLGLILISLQSFIVKVLDKNRSSGIANMFAGVLAGSLCGNVVGAMLAERSGFKIVFYVASCLILLSILYLFFIFKNFKNKETNVSLVQQYTLFNNWKKYFFNLKTIGLILFIAIPITITLVGVLYYITPLYLKKIGMSQGNIGRVLMIYGLCIIYLGPIFSSLIDKMKNKFFIVILSGLISACSLLPLIVFKGVGGVISSVILIGVANACASACLIVFFLEITSNIKVTEQQKVSFFRTLERTGQIIGSFIFANLIVWFGFYRGLEYLFIFLLLCIVFYLIFCLYRKKVFYYE